MTPNKPFAEIIESSLETALAQSWEWDTFPRFGSLVCIQEKTQTILGCVTAIKTGSMDPLRYPFPYQKTEEELRAEQPQIFEFLKTTFQISILGFLEQDSFHYQLPPTPAKIHTFVHHASPQLAADFFSSPDFLYLLFASPNAMLPVDDLLLAIFRQLSTQKKLSHKIISLFCQTFSLHTGNDYRRIKLFLKRVERLQA